MPQPQRVLAALLLLVVAQAAAGQTLEVRVDGVSGELQDNVRAFLSIQRLVGTGDVTERRILRRHTEAESEIRQALQPFGYYRPTVESELVETAEGWMARYRIDPGDPVRITELDIRLIGEGEDDAFLQALVARLPLAEGDSLHHGRYEQAKRELLRRANERGFFDAAMADSGIQVRAEAGTAAVRIHMDTGPQYEFGTVRFHQDTLDEELIRRFSRFSAGDPYRLGDVLDLQSALSDSGYFQRVEVQPRRDLADGQQVPVDVNLEPRPRQRYSMGFGFATDTGARLRPGWEHRRVNRAGHRAGIEGMISERIDRATARYTIPTGDPRTDSVVVSASYIDDSTLAGGAQTNMLGISRNTVRGRLRESLYLNYLVERFRVEGERQRSELVLPGVSWSRTRADDLRYPRSGERFMLDLRGTGDFLGSDATFARSKLEARAIRSPWQPGRIIVRGELGTTALKEFDVLPPSQRFFAGGDQSVRGYAYNSLGPEDADGEVVGGKYLLTSSIEYEHSLTERWSGAVFFDAGNATNHLSDIKMMEGAGFGVRWRSPIGMVRIDLASALSRSGNPWRLHLTIGPDL